MIDFKKYKLGYLGKVITGKTPSSKFPDHFGNHLPFITPSDFGSYIKSAYSSIRYISESGKEANLNKILPKNSILVTCIGSDMGKVVINRKPCLTNQQINSIIPAQNLIEYNFLYYCLVNIYDTLRSLAGDGTTMPIVNKTDFENIEIEIPESLSTQTRISFILSALDDKIELNRRMNHTLEQMAQTLFKKYFVDDIDPNHLPEGWRVQSFKMQLEVDRGLSYKGSGLCTKDEGIPMHNLNSVYEGGGYKYEGIKFYKGEFRERHYLKPWDIIVTNTEQGHKFLLIGCPGVVPYYFGEKGIFSQHIYKIRTKKESYLTSQYLYYLILQSDIRDQIIGHTNGTTVNMLSITGLEKPEFIMPPKELVNTFSKMIIPIWQQKENLHVQNEMLAKIRDSLLPKLMSGEIEVS